MASRFPPIPESEFTPAQETAYSEAIRVVREAFGSSFSLTDSTGALLGPFAVLMYTPNTLTPYLQHTASVLLKSQLSARERELATLSVVSITKAEYIRYAHMKIGIAVGLSQEQVEGAVAGKEDLGLEEREKAVYDIALEMGRNYGRLSDESWERGRETLGREGMAALSQVVASYLHSSVLVNLAEVQVPKNDAEK